jgi:hypothetical protein
MKLSIFLRPNRILTVELHRRFLYYSWFFSGGNPRISLKLLETKIMTLKILNM